MTAEMPEIPWFERLTDSVAHYIDETTSEVYAMRADAPHFIRVTEIDGSLFVALLTDNRAEVLDGDARMTNLPQHVVAATIEAMLR